VASQSVAPQGPPTAKQPMGESQQCVPVPVTPHRPLRHWSLAEHESPEVPCPAQTLAEQ
jgi:hypothetical protein